MKRIFALTFMGVALFAAGVAAAGVDLRRVILKPGQCIKVSKVSVCAQKARPAVTVTSPPVTSRVTVVLPQATVTASPVTVTSPPVTLTSAPVTVTSPPVTVTSPPVTVTSPPVTVTVTTTATPAVTFGAGTFRVGPDIVAGTYRNSNSSEGCYWERLRGFSGTLADVIANEFTYGISIVTILASDAGFKSSRCGTWGKIG